MNIIQAKRSHSLSRSKAAINFLLVCCVGIASLTVGWVLDLEIESILLFFGFALAASVILISLPEIALGVYLVAMGVWIFLPAQLIELLTGYFFPITVLIACFFVVLKYGIRTIALNRLEVALLVFSSFLFLSVGWTSGRAGGLFNAASFFLGTTVFYFLLRWSYAKNGMNLWRLVELSSILGLVPVAVTFVASLYTGGFGPESRIARVFYIQNETNFQYYGLANGLEVAMICAVALFFKNYRSKWKWFWLFLTGLDYWALLALSQRAQIIGVLLACTFLIATRKSFNQFGARVKSGVWLRSSILGVVFLVFMGTIAIFVAAKLNVSFIAEDTNISTRFELYQWAWDGFFQSPLWGHGLGSFSQDFFNVDARIFAHNIFLGMLYEGGLIGFILLAYLLYCMYSYARQLFSSPYLLGGVGLVGIAMCISRLTVGMFSANISSLNIGPWLALIVLAVYSETGEDQVSGSRDQNRVVVRGILNEEST